MLTVCVFLQEMQVHAGFLRSFSASAEESKEENKEKHTGIFNITQSGRFKIDGPVEWTVPEDKVFFGDASVYDPGLARLSILLSMLCYSSGDEGRSTVSEDGADEEKGMDILGLFEALGFSDAEDINIPKNAEGDADIHRTEIFVAHRGVSDGDKKKNVIAIMIRGTNGTVAEWTSNFALGESMVTGEEKADPMNHAGFDVTAGRVLKAVEDYCKDHELDRTSYWLSGHSRGAAIANLAAAKLLDEDRDVRAYTFASPCVTLKEDAGSDKYSAIYNLVNRDDMVPRVPFEGWGYALFGRTAMVAPDEDCREKFRQSITAKDAPMEYEGDSEWLDKLVGSLSTMIPHGEKSIEKLLELGCVHVTGEEGSGVSMHVLSATADYYFGLLPESVREKGHVVKDDANPGYSYICIPPIGIMQSFASLFTNRDMSMLDRLAMLSMFGTYEPLKDLVTALSDMRGSSKASSPHIPYVYYLLLEGLEDGDFVAAAGEKKDNIEPTDTPTPTMEVTPTAEATPTEEAKAATDLTPTEKAASGIEATPTAEATPTEKATPSAESAASENADAGTGSIVLPIVAMVLIICGAVMMVIVKAKKRRLKQK